MAGSARGVLALAACLADGVRAGVGGGRGGHRRARGRRGQRRGRAAVAQPAQPGQGLVDLQNDVTQSDIVLRRAKAFQQRTSQALHHPGHGDRPGQDRRAGRQAIMAALTGRAPGAVSPPIARPPAVPVAIGAYGGAHRGKDFRPTRLTAGHKWAEEQGASFTETGQWLRANGSRGPAKRTGWKPSAARRRMCVPPSASAMSRLWARSTSRDRTQARSRPDLHQHLLDPRRGQGALWRDAA